MSCVLCFLRWRRECPAAFVLFGLSVCEKCGERVADALVNGGSARDILRQAVTAHW